MRRILRPGGDEPARRSSRITWAGRGSREVAGGTSVLVSLAGASSMGLVARRTPNSAARWPIEVRPRRGGNKYEDAPHGEITVRPAPSRPVREFRQHVPRFETVRLRAGRGPRICETRQHERPARAARRRLAGVRRLPHGGVRVVLPQRDRPAAGRAGRDPRGHDGGVRHRLRRRYGVAALGRTPRRRRSSPPSWTPKLATRPQEIFDDDPQVEVLAADWSTLRNKGPYSLLFLDPSVPDGRRASTRSRTWSSRAASSCSTTSRRARSGRRSRYGRVDIAARELADRRAVHRRRGDGRPRRVRAHRDPALTSGSCTMQHGSISWTSGPIASA